MDTFFEQIVQKKKSVGEWALIVLVLLGMALLVAAAFFFPLVIMILAPAGFGAWYVITCQNKEYEYSVTNGDIDIDMIIGKRKRRRLVSVSGRKIEKLLPYTAEAAARQADFQRVVLTAPSAKEEAMWYFTYSSKKNGHTMAIFTPEERVLKALYGGLGKLEQMETDKALDAMGVRWE